jgi:hypothetical protein
MVFCRHLPLWVVVFASTGLTHSLLIHVAPFVELLVCVPVGLLVGATFVCAYAPQLQIVVRLFKTLPEWKAAVTLLRA